VAAAETEEDVLKLIREAIDFHLESLRASTAHLERHNRCRPGAGPSARATVSAAAT
jgi:predicted RNase H-like HicB family nuclease